MVRSVLLGPLPHRLEGLSVAFDLVIKEYIKRKYPYKVIDIGTYSSKKIGSFSFKKIIFGLFTLVKYWRYMLFSDRIYLLVGLSQFGFLRDFIIVGLAKLHSKFVILHIHSGGYGIFYKSQNKFIKLLIRIMLNNSDSIIILGKLLYKQFNFLPSIRDKIQVVPNGLPIDLNIGHIKPKSINPKKPIRLLYLSNLIKSKGYLDCLEACKIIYNEKKIPITIDFCGEIVEHKYLEDDNKEKKPLESFLKLINQKDLSGIAQYHGIVSGQEKIDFLKRAHILLLPTYYSLEGQPICIIESLSFGIPVITTEYRGIPEQIINDFNGFLVSPKNPEEIANCIQFLWSDPNKYINFSLNARKHFKKYFTTEAHIEKLLPIITGIK